MGFIFGSIFFYVKLPTYFYWTLYKVIPNYTVNFYYMVDDNLADQEDIEAVWHSVVEEIQQRYNLVADLIEWFEDQPDAKLSYQHTISQLTYLQQQLLNTLSKLLTETHSGSQPLPNGATPNRLQQVYSHTQILQKLKQRVDQEVTQVKERHALRWIDKINISTVCKRYRF